MEIDELIRYLIWVVFFAAALMGIYLMLKKLGVI